VGSLINQDNTIRGGGGLGLDAAATAITNAGTIRADAAISLNIDPHDGIGFANTGTLHVTGSGGMQILDGPMNHSGTAIVEATRKLTRTGNWTQTGGSTQVDGVLDVNSGIVDLQEGTLAGSGRVETNVANTGTGTVAPGNSTDTLSIVGTYNQGANATLAIELGGYASGEYDLLSVSGAATLGGTVTVTLVNGFVPEPGDTFIVLKAASRSGVPNVVAVNFPPYLTVTPLPGTSSFGVVVSGVTSVGEPPAIAFDRPLVVYPNPAAGGQVGIAFRLPGTSGDAELSIYDTAGRRVATVFSGAVTGPRYLTWDARDRRGSRVRAGLYYARLTARDGFRETRRFTLLR
jgi:hypothetical protein